MLASVSTLTWRRVPVRAVDMRLLTSITMAIASATHARRGAKSSNTGNSASRAPAMVIRRATILPGGIQAICGANPYAWGGAGLPKWSRADDSAVSMADDRWPMADDRWPMADGR